MRNAILFLLSVCVGIGVAFFIFQKEPTQNKKKIIQQDSFSIEAPPSQSQQGTVASQSGVILYEPRSATEPAELAIESVKQGERIMTKDKSAITITFPSITASLGEDADVTFDQTLPVELVLKQLNGTVTYTVSGATPLSARFRNALLRKTSGEITIEMRNGDPVILIRTVRGVATIGFNDDELISRVFELREGQVYEYNSDERTAINVTNVRDRE